MLFIRDAHGRIGYTIRFLDSETIEFKINYGSLRSIAKSLEGLKDGMKEMLAIERTQKDFCDKVFM